MLSATVLVDNIAADGLKSEWGLSVLIEFGGKKILLDVGASDIFLQNAKKLGVDIADVDFAVLSHAHSDHAGGMREFFTANKKAKFFLQEKAAENCYGKFLCFHKYIGTPRGVLREFAHRIERVSGHFQLCDGVHLLSHAVEIPESRGLADKLFVKDGWRFHGDTFKHEQSLVFDLGGDEIAIFNSCSHAGADVIINEVQNAFPNKKIRAIFGGFHLFRRSDDEIRAFAERLKATGTPQIFTGHCTRERAFKILSQILGDKARQIRCGMKICL